MADKLVFYTNPMSRGRIARWMLEEVGAPYETVVLEYGTTMKAPEYLAVNPMGKVPALKHGETVVTECAAICAYLADAFPQAGLAPAPTDRMRGPYYRWLFFAAGPVEAATTNASLGVTADAERQQMVGYGSHASCSTFSRERSRRMNICWAGVSQRPTSILVRTSVGACNSAAWKSARPSSIMSRACRIAPPPSALTRSTTR